ncbi:MAG: RNA polymerase sigma factor [Opitutaceae bacterium]|nr:RNA polymerase sigma factor [Opitutaceae bacterium]
MSTADSSLPVATLSDAELVAACVAGDRHAFGGIVDRYKRLLCSLAYSATGSVSESEDVAQEAFVTAWQQLRDLREPEKLRSWLCGILRFKLSRARRRDGREPVRRAEDLEAAAEVISTEESAMNQAMNEEELRILWAELARVPEIYREPLVLYYREHQSIEHVAAALDLSEDAVKQRLARGRRILQERVLAFVESALMRSTPGRAFTVGVIAAIPAMLPAPAKAAGLAAAAAHGSTLVKGTAIAALLASVSGFVTTVMGLRANLDQSRTPRERRAVVKTTVVCFFGSLGFIFVLWALRAAAFRWWDERAVFAVVAQVLVLAFIVFWPVAVVRMLRHFRRLRSEERRRHPECFSDPRDQVGSAASVYRSRATLFGVPLLHFRYSSPDDGERPVVGWIAGGDRAYGLLFAWGGIAVAPVSVGLFSVGFVSVGALGVGIFGLGTVGVGVVALGCLTVGVQAFAWLSALGWSVAAAGGFGIAHSAALAPVAYAQHANDATAQALLANPHGHQIQTTFFIVISVLSLIPAAYFTSEVRRRLGPKARKPRDRQ